MHLFQLLTNDAAHTAGQTAAMPAEDMEGDGAFHAIMSDLEASQTSKKEAPAEDLVSNDASPLEAENESGKGPSDGTEVIDENGPLRQEHHLAPPESQRINQEPLTIGVPPKDMPQPAGNVPPETLLLSGSGTQEKSSNAKATLLTQNDDPKVQASTPRASAEWTQPAQGSTQDMGTTIAPGTKATKSAHRSDVQQLVGNDLSSEPAKPPSVTHPDAPQMRLSKNKATPHEPMRAEVGKAALELEAKPHKTMPKPFISAAETSIRLQTVHNASANPVSQMADRRPIAPSKIATGDVPGDVQPTVTASNAEQMGQMGSDPFPRLERMTTSQGAVPLASNDAGRLRPSFMVSHSSSVPVPQNKPIDNVHITQFITADSQLASVPGMPEPVSNAVFHPFEGGIASGEIKTSGLASASAIQSSGPVNRPDTAQHIARQLAEALPASGDRPIEIALNPVELGRVRMALTTSDTGITLIVHAERPETLEMMRRNISDLGSAFADLGYADINFAFSGGEDSDAREDAQDKPQSQKQSPDSIETDTSTQPRQIQLTLGSSAGMDLRV